MNRKGISTILAALLLIAIAVAAAILLYVFAMGLMTTATQNGGVSIFTDQVTLESYNWPTGTTLTLTLRNIGSTTLNLASADYYVNGQTVNAPAIVCQNPSMASQFQPKGVCTVTLTVTLANLNQGQTYPVRVAFADGGLWQGAATFGAAA
jgi:flagellin-like protein